MAIGNLVESSIKNQANNPSIISSNESNSGVHSIMTITSVLDVNDALDFATTSTDPIEIVDTAANIGAQINALIKLGSQLVSIQNTDFFSIFDDFGNLTIQAGNIDNPISIPEFLALAPKTIDMDGNPAVFTHINGSLQDFLDNETQLSKLGSQFDGYDLPDGSHFQVVFGNNDNSVFSISMNAADASKSADLILTSLHPSSLQVIDSGLNITENIDTLINLGPQLNWLQDTDQIEYVDWFGNINVVAIPYSNPITLTDFLKIAPKVIDFQGGRSVFTHITGSFKDFINHEDELAKLSQQFGGYSLPDGTDFKVTFEKSGYSIIMDAANTANANTFIAAGLTQPINVIDSGANISSYADALVNLGAQLVSIQDSDTDTNDISGLPVDNSTAISLNDFLALAPKTVNSEGLPAVFTEVTGSFQDFLSHQAELAALSQQFGGYTVPNGPHFQVNFSSNSNNILIMDAANAAKMAALDTQNLNISFSILDIGSNIAANADTLINLGSQLINIQTNDTNGLGQGNPISGAISLNDFLLIAPKTIDYEGQPVVFNDVTGTLQDFIDHKSLLLPLAQQLGGYTLEDGSHFQITFNPKDDSVSSIQMDANNAVKAGISITDSLQASTLEVVDKGANIVAQADALIGLGSQLKILRDIDSFSYWDTSSGDFVTSPIACDSAISVTEFLTLAPKTVDINGKPAIFNNVTGNFEDIINNSASLIKLGQQLGGYTLTDGTHFGITFTNDSYALTMDAAQAAKLTGLIPKGLTLPIQVIDTEANINTYSNELMNLGVQLVAIQATDILGITDLLYLTANGIQGPVSTVKFGNIFSGNITDSAAHIQSSLDTLESNIEHINSIHFNDIQIPTLTLTSTQWIKDKDVLSKLTTPYKLSLTHVKADVLESVLNDVHVSLPINVTDGALKIFNILDLLQSHLDKINTITLSNNNVNPVLFLSANQYHSDQATLEKINADNNQYTLHLRDENWSQLLTDLNDLHVTQVSLADSVSEISANLDSLATIQEKLGTISFTDTQGAILKLSAEQYWADKSVLSKITSPYQLSLSGETVTRALKDTGNDHISDLTIADSAYKVMKHFSELLPIKHLTDITLTDKNTPTLTLNSIDANDGSMLLNSIDSTYNLSIKDTVSNLNTLNLTHLTSMSSIEIMPTQFDANLHVDSFVNAINLSFINLYGDTINKKAYGQSGTEIDILTSKGTLIEQMIFSHDTESQLHILGVSTSIIHSI